MSKWWVLFLVLGLAAGAMAQGTQTGGNSGGSTGQGYKVNEGLDLSFGHEQKGGDLYDPSEEEEEEEEGPEDPPEPPELYGEEIPVETAEIVYIIDRSCSMQSGYQTFINENGQQVSGYRMDRAKSEVISSVNALSSNFKFDIVAFDCAKSYCFGTTMDATEGNKISGAGWTAGLSPTGATGTGPTCAWALGNYGDCRTFVLVTDGGPNCMDSSGWSSGSWQQHAAMISGANGDGDVIHVILISPSYADMISFGQAVSSQNGPGQLTIVN